MKPCPYPVERLLAHAHPMILIDEIVGYEPERLRAAVAIRPGIPFFEDGRGVAAHVAMEWMAQACGALIGVEMIEKGEPVRLGFLLGTRNFKAAVPWFRDGERVIVGASLVFRDRQMGVFDCVVLGDPGEETLAAAQLATYQPDDVDALMEMQRRGKPKADSVA